MGGTRIHSVRLPSFVATTEVIFGGKGERLTMRHDAGESPEPYVAGTFLPSVGLPMYPEYAEDLAPCSSPAARTDRGDHVASRRDDPRSARHPGKERSGTSSVTSHTAVGRRGCLTRAREPTRNGPSSSRSTLVTLRVHSGQRSTSE